MGITQQIGNIAEEQACKYLLKQGLKLLTRNFRCKLGEIDLIMQDNNELVFVEVRCRKNNNFGTSAESVTSSKQKKLLRAAEYYLSQMNDNDRLCRFDVIAITSGSNTLEWIKDAF